MRPLGASSNTLVFGNAMLKEPSLVEELDQGHNNATLVSIRAYVDEFMQRQGKLLNAAMGAQATNVRNLRKRYANYKGLPELRIRRIREDIEEEHEEPRDSPTSIAHIFVNGVKPVQPIFIRRHTISKCERHGARGG